MNANKCGISIAHWCHITGNLRVILHYDYSA